MNYIDFKQIMRHLKKNLPCSTCGKKFPDEGINLISSLNNSLLFHFTCPQCKNELVAEVSIIEQTQAVNRLNINTKPAESIKPNDVLDIHDFLNSFDGDFIKLFSNRQN